MNKSLKKKKNPKQANNDFDFEEKTASHWSGGYYIFGTGYRYYHWFNNCFAGVVHQKSKS